MRLPVDFRLDLSIGNPDLAKELKDKSKEQKAKYQFGLVEVLNTI